jgi:hydrogenase maturation protease
MIPRTLVLGLGNVLLRDEGIGVWIAESLRRRWWFPPEVLVIEGGTLGLDLLPRLDAIERLLLIDAVTVGREPGSVVRLEGDAVPAALAVKISPHQIGVQDLLAVARFSGAEPPRVVLCGMEPERLDPGIGFSPRVRARLSELEERVLAELRDWGILVNPRSTVPAPSVWWEEPTVGRLQ